MKVKISFLKVFVFLVFFGGCGGNVDTTKDFAMLENGREYRVLLDRPVAGILEQESGYSTSYRFTVTFPLQKYNPMKARGFELTFDPAKVEIGKVIESRAGDSIDKPRIHYYPAMGHKLNEGILLAYSSGMETGSLRVRFDILEPSIGGRVKGTVLNAVLYGYYEAADTAEITKPDPPKKLEIYNFPFDAVFERSLF
jgi:hypothetical protein